MLSISNPSYSLLSFPFPVFCGLLFKREPCFRCTIYCLWFHSQCKLSNQFTVNLVKSSTTFSFTPATIPSDSPSHVLRNSRGFLSIKLLNQFLAANLSLLFQETLIPVSVKMAGAQWTYSGVRLNHLCARFCSLVCKPLSTSAYVP